MNTTEVAPVKTQSSFPMRSSPPSALKKYTPFPPVKLARRRWPDNTITKAPVWCSVDLRDGNQALPVPMTVEQKLELFDTLVACGFKEIEVGFPAASPTEYAFVRRLIEEHRIPEDVTIQVLVQAREGLIKETVNSLIGAKKVIIHLYNSTSPAQRRIVFGMNKAGVICLAEQGARWVKEYSSTLTENGTQVTFQYSPESFSATEVYFALEVCEIVMNTWEASPTNKVIINLPCTVEVATPNVYADQIEWFCTRMSRRDSVIISVHTHNDRGTGVAATELGMLAGADRVEGTLFGNGERTGNLDIIIVALNLLTQGVDPELDFSKLDQIREVYERCTGMTVPERQPYSGDLVFTAFSGSHQDAIRKGLSAIEHSANPVWDVPYLTIDPHDIGREYGTVIRVNGQSGKGGIAYLLEREYRIFLPKDMVREFGSIAGKEIDAQKREVNAHDVKEMFWSEYVNRTGIYTLEYPQFNGDLRRSAVTGFFDSGNGRTPVSGDGNGPIDAFVSALRTLSVVRSFGDLNFSVVDQAEQSLGIDSSASAIAYVKLKFSNGETRWGAGVHENVAIASMYAIVSALNRYAVQDTQQSVE